MEQVNGAVAAVTTHHPPLPMLIRDRPLDWFALIEFQLTARKITKPIDKFSAIVNSLPVDVQANLADVFRKINELPDPFKTVKDRLCQSFERSPFDLCSEIIDHPPLGADKPSVLLDKMIILLPPDESQGHLFQTHFLRRLPTNIRQHLSHKTFASTREMAAFADTIFDMEKSNSISAAATPLTRSRSRSPSPAPRRRSATPWRRPRQPYVEGNDLCYYHYTFGPKATKCQQPCKFKSKN